MTEHATLTDRNRRAERIQLQEVRKFFLDHPTCQKCKRSKSTRMIATSSGGREALCKSCKADHAPARRPMTPAEYKARLARLAPLLFSR